MRRSLILTAAACLAAAIASPAGADASPAPVTFALIGDTPYGDAQRAIFPTLIDRIDADPDVRFGCTCRRRQDRLVDL